MSGTGARELKGSLIVTARLRLRPFAKRDAAAVIRLSASDAARHNVTMTFISAAETDGRVFVIEAKDARGMIGAGGFHPVVDRPGAVEFAVCFAETKWGAGYGTEATKALVDIAFADATVSEVWASVRVTNARARRVYEKCGFQPRGTGMARASAGSFPVEHIVLNRGAWVSLKAWGGATVTNGSNAHGKRQSAA
jgi:RimJ/RimL family protein N-acetyltransferase